MFFWKKKEVVERDPNAERRAEQSRISNSLDKAEDKVRGLQNAAQYMRDDLRNGNLGAASYTARSGGFSHSVGAHLDTAEKHHRQDYRASESYKSERESRALAVQEIAKASSFARADLRAAADKAKELRQRLRDT